MQNRQSEIYARQDAMEEGGEIKSCIEVGKAENRQTA